jgi:hypothetical protein
VNEDCGRCGASWSHLLDRGCPFRQDSIFCLLRGVEFTPRLCPIQVRVLRRWIDCTFPAGHGDWLHSWQTPGAPVFRMAPPVTDVRNRNGGPLGYPYDP